MRRGPLLHSINSIDRIIPNESFGSDTTFAVDNHEICWHVLCEAIAILGLNRGNFKRELTQRFDTDDRGHQS